MWAGCGGCRVRQWGDCLALELHEVMHSPKPSIERQSEQPLLRGTSDHRGQHPHSQMRWEPKEA